MKTLAANQKCLVFTLFTVLILSIGIQNVSYGQANTRTVRLFYFLPNGRSYRQEVVDAMKTGILEVQSFYADQMAAHGHGDMTFRIETNAQGVPIVHRVNGDYSDSHYKDRKLPENEISREFDISSIVQLVVMDISRSSGGRGTGVKQSGQAIIDGGWNWRTAAHELGHAFGLQHDFRDKSYIMSYGSGRNSLSAGAANYLAVNPYFNHSIPLQAGSAPSVQLLSSTNYMYGVVSHIAGNPIPPLNVPVRLRVRDPNGLQQVTLFVKTPEGINLPTGYNEVVSYHNLSGQTDATVTFNYKGGLPSKGDDDTSLLDQLRHTIYVSAVDKQGNRIDNPPSWTLQAINIQQAKVPVSTRSPRVRDSIYNVVRSFHDRSVSVYDPFTNTHFANYDHITDAHLAKIGALLVNNIELLSSPLQYGDFDGLTNLSRLELRLGSGFSESSLMPAGIFEGLTSLNSLKFLYYTNIYGDDPSLYPLIPLTVGLKKVGEGQFRVVVPTGAPFDMDVPIIVVNGSINGGAESATIPAGSVESEIITVTRTPNTTAAVIVDLERTVPSPPESGYVFYKSSYHLEIFNPLAGAPTPVAERTPQVLDAIVAAVPEINHIHHDRDLRYMVNGKFIDKKYNMGHYVSEAHLAAITSLNAPGSNGVDLSLGGNWFSLHGDITELKPGDFDGMTNLTKLRLDGNELSSFPENIFDNLTNLTALNLADNELSSLPAGLFDNLTNLTTLSLGGNQLSSLPAGIFDQLTNLTNLTLYSNQLISLPAGLFDNLTNLTTLNLLDNPLTQLPEGYFDNLTNLTTLFLPPTITPPPLPGASEVTPVADRTPQVRDAIVAAAGVNSAADVTAGHLAAITADLQVENISVLKQGDFDNLTNLEGLGIGGTFSSLPDGIFDHLINLDKFALVSTQLSSLPEGICDNLINLTFFAIANTPLSSLPDSLFDNLTKVSTIYLINTQLSSLPDGIFDNLTNMPYIFLYNNQLSSLPSGIFNKATMIVALSNNQLSSLPDGIFEGIFDEPPDLTGTELFGVPLGPISEDQLAELGDYTIVVLTGNLVDPLPLTVSLERVANGQFKAVAPAGAPFNLVLPIRVTNGSINGSAESITIPVGSVESDTFTVTRTPGTTFSVSVDIETLPGLPDGHSGYTLVKSDELPIVFTELGGRLLLPVSERTPEVRDAIVDAILGVNSAADVTEAHLAAITSFGVSLGSSVKVGDFAGLTGVTQLSLGTGQLTSLPAGLFNGLTGVTVLGLGTRQLTSLPAGLFNDFSNVTYIEWTDEKLITLPVDAFQGFTNLENFGWYAGGLTSLPAGVLDPLTNLTDLEINAPQLNTLPDGIFDNLTNLTGLGCSAGQLGSLPDGIFDQLTNLTGLSFHAGQLTSLPDNLFNQLPNLTDLSLFGSHPTSLLDGIRWPTTLTSLRLYSTQLSTLPDGVFAGLPSLTTLILNNNNLTSLPPDIFSELPNLTGLYIRNNQLSTLPDGLFFGLSSLTTLRLDGNAVDPLPLTVSLEKVADGQFKAVTPAGAPFDIVLLIAVTNGSISGGTTTLTIPAGSVESDTLTITRTLGATAAVTVDIGTLLSRPANHSGYSLVKSDDLPITVIGGDTVDGSVLTLTVGAGPGAALRGYNQHSAPEWDFGSFSPQSFELNGVSYTMYKLTYSVAGKRLALQTIPHLPGGFALHLDAQQFTSVTALDYNQYTWNNVELDWSDGKTVQIGFITTTPMPPGPPTNLQATPGYEKVTLSWIPPANADPIALPITEYEYRISVDGGNTWDPDWETIGLGRTGHNTLTSCTFGDRNNNRNVDNLIDINLTNGTSYTFEIRARGGDGYSEAARITVVPDGSTPVSERTPQVRDAIVAAVLGVNSANDVTEAHLAAITSLSVRSRDITALRSNDFDGLTALTTLSVGGTKLSSLPAGIFDNLPTLTELYLGGNNDLNSLPSGIFDDLPALKKLYLNENGMPSLRSGVFDNLTVLEELGLKGNDLRSLPSGIFDNLTALKKLNMSYNELVSLRSGVFDNNTALTELHLYYNDLSSLPSGIFDNNTALTTLTIWRNNLRSLRAGVFDNNTALTNLSIGFNNFSSLPSGIFEKLTNLIGLGLLGNQFRSLPNGIFKGFPTLASLNVSQNPVDPLPLTVSLEKVADGEFKAVALTGAPFEIVLPIRVTHGSINGGATMLTIPAGSVGSDTLTVTSTSEFAVSADIGRLPSLPNNHTGYTLVKSADLPLKVTEGDNPDTFAFTMTVGRLGENSPYPTNRFGFDRPRSPFTPHGSLSRQTFNFKGVTYTVTALYYDIDHNTREKYLFFQTSPLFPRGFELYLDSQQFNSSACDYVPRRQDFGGWNAWRRNVDLNWSIGQTVQVKLVETTPMPPGPPTNLQATTTDFKNVTLTWEPHVNTDLMWVEEYELRISDDGGTTWDRDWEYIVDSASGEENRSSVTIGRFGRVHVSYTFSNDTEYTFEVRAKGGDGYGDATRVTLVMDGITPLSSRTPQVRDAIVAAVAGVNSAADVTEAHLAAITSVFLLRDNITTLKAGDFDGLTALTSLDLSENQLSTLPEGIFDDLTALTTLELHDNQLSTLPEDIFDGLTELRTLQLQNNQLSTLPEDIFDGQSNMGELFLFGNQLTALPAGIFDKLTVLRTLNLEGNQLSTLPEGIFNKLTELNYLTLADNRLTTLPEGIFEGPSALYDIWLDGNQFTTLPAGIFKMTASFLTLRKLYLEDNAVDPLPLIVSLEKVADGQFKAVAPAGATFDFVLQISTANGTINGGTTTLTIPKGSVESDTLSVTRTAGTTTAVTVDIGTLPQLPTSHQGYELVKSTDLPLEVMGATATQVISVNIPDANLRAKIESALGKTSGDPITAAEMATLTTLTAQDASITNLTGLETATNLTTLKLGNNAISNISALSGLINLTELHLWDNQITNLSSLTGLTNLTKLYLWGNSISDISHLSGLTNLRQLRIGENNISNISAVSRLTNLTYLSVKENAISDISAVSRLTNLAELVIGNNTISDITPIQNLTNLEWLDMPNNSISDISAVQNLTQLVELYFQNNAVSDLSPLVTNTGLGTDDELDVRGNLLSYPSIYTHIPALQARNAYVDFDNRVATAPVKISGDTQQGNTGATLAQPFIVEVQDGSSVAFAGVPVTFVVTAGGGTLSATNTTTDVNGRAETTLTLGNTAGTNTVRVSVTGITQTITFTATATTTNTAPVFTEGASTTRTIAENTASGVNIGSAVSATDVDNDTLTYSLSGTDAAAFNVDSNTGQLKTRNALDYETKTTYMVTVTVTDGSLTDTITVTISVTDIADTAVTSTLTPVRERTLQVREAILGVVRLNFPTISGYDAITKSHLSGITTLYLNNQNITSLKAGDFDDLIGLEELRLNNNQLTTLPDGIFNNLTSLTDINLYNNQLSSLPTGIFEGLTSLTTLRLGRNVVDPFPLTVSLQKAGEGQFKAVVPTGAPFDIVLPLSVANGSITGGATTLIISHGSVESDFLTVTATPGTTAAVTVDIRTFPSLPRNHYGYALVKSEDLPLAVISGINTAPTFTEGTRTTRTVAENTAAAVNIGIPITVTDAENDTLIYSLSGADASTFDIDSNTGQLKTKAALDYETKTTYTVTITVSDGSLTDTITVTINITDIEELPTPTAICEVGDILAPGESCTYPGTDTEFSVLGNGNGQFLFFTSGSSLNIKGTEINGESYTLVAKKLRSGSWEIEEIGDSGDQQTVTREQPGDTGGTPTITASTAAPLTEATLHEGVITLNLSGGTYEQSSFRIRNAVSVSGITGITLDSFGTERISDTEATVKLEFDGNLNTDGTLTITLGADAIADYDGTALTAQIPVTAVAETIAASTLAPLAEATLDESIITLTLSGRKFESSRSKIRGAVSISGISGVTVQSLDIDRESDTEVTVELTFNGNINTDGTLTFTVGANAIAGYNGPALTAQVSVSASEAPGEIDDQPPEPPQDDTPPATDTRTTFEASTPPGYTRVTLKKTGTVYGIPTKYTSDSDVGTVAYMALAKLTDCNFADAEVDRRSIVYIKRQSLGQLNNFASESVCGKTSSTWSDAWDAVRITHLRFYDETGFPNIKEAVYNAATDQIEIPGTWQPPDEPTINDSQDPDPSEQPGENTDRTPTPTTSTTVPLTEATLNGGVITLSLDDQIYELSVFKIRNAMSVAGIPGVTIDSVERVSDMEIAVALTFNGNIDTDATLTFTVDAGAIVDYTGPAFTAQTSVPAVTESIVASTAAPLTEAALDESIITLTLSGRKYERFNSTIRPAVSVSGISGVTVGTFDIDRESDMEITVELTFDGDITTDGTLTFTVGAGAIAGYNGPTLTAQVSVSASTDAPDDTTPVTVDTTPVEDDTTPGVCKVGDVLAPGESCTYPGTDTEFSVLGNGNGQFLFFTSGSSLNIKGTEINGESYTLVAKKLRSGSWEIEEIGDSGDQQPVTPEQPQQPENTGGTPTLTTSTATPLTEATLHEGIVTLTLSGGTFDHSIFTIRDAITLTGISGVTVDTFGVDRVSDTQATVELVFDGNMTSTRNLTISLGADAITDYDGTALTSQLSVSAVTESITASTASPLTEATLDESVVTLTLSGRKYERLNPTIRDAVSVSGIAGVTVRDIDIDRESDTEITVELTFDGDITTDGTLTFTVGAGAIAGYNGPALTAQVSVSAGTVAPVDPVTPVQPGTPTLRISTATPLTEATLHEGVITLNLSDGTFERNKFTIRDAITLSGISGVTADAFGVDRVSDTEATVELAFDGNMTSDSNLTISLGANAITDYDGAALTSQLSVSAVTESVTASTAAPLTEATLDESVVTLTLSGRKYERWNSTIRPAVSVSGISGVTVGTFDIDRESDTEITVELTFDGDITVDGTLTFTVGAGAITGYNGPALTVQVSVSASTETPVVTDGQTPVTPQQPGDKDPPEQPDNTGGTPTLSVTTAAPLTESTLHEGVITLNLSGGTFERNKFTIRDAITLTGITGVTVDTFGVDRVSDTKVTVELAFDGNMTTDSTLTISVGAGAIKDYNGTALTSQISVRAVTESMAASTASPLTEVTLDESIVTLTLNGAKYARSIFDIRGAVSVSGISGVTKPWSQPDRKSDTEVTVELEFDGTDFDTTSTLTFTVEADAIAGYNGPALTTQISVSAVTESVVASTPAPLKEATLDGSVVTLTLSGAKYSGSIWDIRGGVTVSGITGVTIPWNQPDRKSDTQITIELEFDGNMNTDGTLTFTVGANAIENYSGSALTTQVTVTADRENVLLANFPNPFNPETWIPYQLAKPAEVTITIYAINGQAVRTLALGHQAAGMYQNRSRAAYWDGRNEFGEKVASGLYFYTLTAGNFTATRKMLIRK